jgi:hypothetical protein
MKRSARLFAAATIAVIVFATASVGYAAASGYFGPAGGGQHGSVRLVWTSPTSATPSPSFVKCTESLSPLALGISATNLAPGGKCTYSAVIETLGTLPASLGAVIFLVSSGGCKAFQYTDNIFGVHPAPSISAGGTFVYSSTFTLLSSARNLCEGTHALLLVVISGVGGRCDNSNSEWSCN